MCNSPKHTQVCCLWIKNCPVIDTLSNEMLDPYNAGHDIWGESDVPGCNVEKTFDEAVATCALVGARLCTKKELHDDCTRSSGCGFDDQYVWSI